MAIRHVILIPPVKDAQIHLRADQPASLAEI
jgi:hypothetical protein